MAQTFSNTLFHFIFSTKDRRPLIASEFKDPLFHYMGGILRDLDGRTLGINGMADHVHILAELPPRVAVATALREIKAGSSRWIHERHRKDFA